MCSMEPAYPVGDGIPLASTEAQGQLIQSFGDALDEAAHFIVCVLRVTIPVLARTVSRQDPHPPAREDLANQNGRSAMRV